jgi:GNAT superfamily N-acetyltransferase
MYKTERFRSKNMSTLKSINEIRRIYNSLNEDFFESYYFSYNNNLLKKLILLSNLNLLKYENKVVGYIWYEKLEKRHFMIKCLSFTEVNHFVNGIYELIKCFKPNTVVSYYCEKNDFNFSNLEKLGFLKEQGTFELIREIPSFDEFEIENNVTFEMFIKGVHESKRCEIQNDIFQSQSREPLTLEDINFDIEQDYYIENGAVFIKYNDEYIGYGQVIMDDGLPTIVNFGIVKNYRNKGYGNILLKHIINLIYSMDYFKCKIKVYNENHNAINLYINNGFKKTKEYYMWNYLT